MSSAPRRLTLRQHMLLLPVWAALPLILLGGFQVYRTHRSNMGQMRSEVRHWRDSVAEQVDAFFSGSAARLGSLATNSAPAFWSPESFRSLALPLIAGQSGDVSLTWLDVNGRVRASTDSRLAPGTAGAWPSLPEADAFTVADVYQEEGGAWLVPMLQPIFVDGNKSGTLLLLAKVQAYLERHLARTWPQSGVVVMAFDSAGTVALHSQRPGYYVGRHFPQFREFTALHDSGQTEGLAPGFDENDRLYASARIRQSPWVLRASVRQSEAMVALWEQMQLSVVLLGLSVLLAGLAAHRLARRLAQPATALAEAARAFAAGQPGAPLPESGPVEVAATARAFNEMVAERQRAKSRLQASESRYRLLFENMTAGFVLCEVFTDPASGLADFRFLEVNPAVERITGIPASRLVGRLGSEALPGLDRFWFEHCERAALTGEAASFERHSPDLGKHLDVFAFRPGPGQLAVVFNDVTERHRAQDALRVAHRRHSSLVNSIGGIVWERAPDGSYSFVSPQAERILGYPVDRWLSEPGFWEQHLHPEDREWAPARRSAESGAGRDHSLDFRMVHADGRAVWLRDIVSIIEGGIPGRVIGVMFDITEQKFAELALRESERRLELALEGGDLSLWDWDLTTGQVRYGARWAAMLEYGPGNLDPTIETWERLVHPEDLPGVKARMDTCFVRDEAAAFESAHRLRASSGRWVWVMARGRVVGRDAEGRPIRAAGTHLDITATRNAEEEHAALERKVLETQKLESLGILAGGIAHDFNNLLTGILGNASLARLEMAPGSPGLESLAEVEKAAERAANLCKQMLAYSGRGRFVIQQIDLNRIIQDTTHLLHLSIGKGVLLRFELAPALPAIEVDVTQIRQVIMNLVINASEAIGARSGIIAISTGIVRADTDYLRAVNHGPAPGPGDYVWVEVSDTGCGMSQETLARIFDPFFTTKFTGRGLGLAAVLGIVRGHHGAVLVDSQPGRGTTFRLLFPATEGLAETPTTSEAASAPWHGSGHILIVDDDETIRALTARLLARLGFTTEATGDPREGIALFARSPQRYQLVLLDLTMPHLGGEETFRRLREIRPDQRVVLMSGYTEEDATARFAGEGLAGFVQKPFDSAALTQELRRVLGTA